MCDGRVGKGRPRESYANRIDGTSKKDSQAAETDKFLLLNKMDYISGWCRSARRLDGCTAVVTGCNTGIGKETALDLYKRGARVIMACRDLDSAEKAKRQIERTCSCENNYGTLIVRQLDLSNFASIEAFAKRVLSENGNDIKILVNNAGVMMYPESRTADGFEVHMATNHLGHALLTLLLLPRIRASAPARIIFVSSYLHQYYPLDIDDLNFEKTNYDPYGAYCRSKAANVMFARALADRLKEHRIEGVKTYSLHPGVIRTEISRHFSSTYWPGATWIFNNVLGMFLKSPRCGAQTTIYCAVDEACANESGLYYSDCRVKDSSKETQSRENVNRLWEVTIKALKLENYDPFI